MEEKKEDYIDEWERRFGEYIKTANKKGIRIYGNLISATATKIKCKKCNTGIIYCIHSETKILRDITSPISKETWHHFNHFCNNPACKYKKTFYRKESSFERTICCPKCTREKILEKWKTKRIKKN